MYSTKEMSVLRLYGPVYDVPAIPITETRGNSTSQYDRTLTISELHTQEPIYSFKDEVKAYIQFATYIDYYYCWRS